jgi:hypothetical protein
MADKPMITITDANDVDHITLRVEGGEPVTVHNDPVTVADAIHQINNPE